MQSLEHYGKEVGRALQWNTTQSPRAAKTLSHKRYELHVNHRPEISRITWNVKSTVFCLCWKHSCETHQIPYERTGFHIPKHELDDGAVRTWRTVSYHDVRISNSACEMSVYANVMQRKMGTRRSLTPDVPVVCMMPLNTEIAYGRMPFLSRPSTKVQTHLREKQASVENLGSISLCTGSAPFHIKPAAMHTIVSLTQNVSRALRKLQMPSKHFPVHSNV